MTKPEVILKPQAREDVKQIAAYIAEDSPQSSLAFRQTLQNIYEVLLELPEMGTTRNFHNPEMKGLRMLPVRNLNPKTSAVDNDTQKARYTKGVTSLNVSRLCFFYKAIIS